MYKKILLLLISLFIIFCITSCDFLLKKPTTTNTGATESIYPENMYLGNPSDAVADETVRDNYLMIKDSFSLSYSDTNKTPNWVSWHLDSNDNGTYPRPNRFIIDEELPSSWNALSHDDYTSSGFDRGHMCPNADRSGDEVLQKETFLMTNIIPQNPNCNQGVWKDLEEWCRDEADKGKELYIVSGPYGVGGENDNSVQKDYIVSDGDKTEIKVPSHCWKVIIIMDAGDDDLSRLDSSVTAFGVWMPNNNTIGYIDGKKVDWEAYKCSIDCIEEKTGYDFYDIIGDELETIIEKEGICICNK